MTEPERKESCYYNFVQLSDGIALAKEFPYTFEIPSKKTLKKLKKGDLVKLIFEIESNDDEATSAERMWVKIQEQKGKSLTGLLDNKPKFIQNLKIGDLIDFEERHIIATEYAEDIISLPQKYSKHCFVTNNILYEGTKIGYLYRENPDHDDDSGWRIMPAEVSDEYLNNAENCSYVSLGAVLTRDDSIVDILSTP
jgi:hypothetical protein